MICGRDEVVLALFRTSTCEPRSDAPHWVVQADGLPADLPQTLVAMITRNVSRAGHPSRVMAPMDSPAAEGSDLPMDSVIMTTISPQFTPRRSTAP
jgi:mRNA interferase MazF